MNKKEMKMKTKMKMLNRKKGRCIEKCRNNMLLLVVLFFSLEPSFCFILCVSDSGWMVKNQIVGIPHEQKQQQHGKWHQQKSKE